MPRYHHEQRSRSPSLDPDDDPDYQLALQLSAELNGDQSAPPDHQPDYDADAEFALAMQLQFDNEAQATEGRHTPHTGESSAPLTFGHSAWGLDEEDSSVAVYLPETPSGRVPKEFTDFIACLVSSKCKCGEQLFRSELDVNDMFQNWLSGKKALSSWIKCRGCLTSLCFGCIPEPFAKQSTINVQGKQVSWCCAGGRLYLIWMLLCGFDQHFCAARAKKEQKNAQPAQQNQRGGKAKIDKKTRGSGVGFGSDRRYSMSYMPSSMDYGNNMVDFEDLGGYPTPSFFEGKGHTLDPNAKPAEEHCKNKAQSAQQAEDNFNTMILELLKGLLPSLDRDVGFDVDPPEAVTDMLVDSKILNFCVELLRNDSLDDATKRKSLYHALLSFLQAIGMHVMANRTLFSERSVQPDAVNLLTLSFRGSRTRSKETASSVADSLRNLNTQSVLVLQSAKTNEKDFHSVDGQDMLLLCREISELSQYILAYTEAGSNQNVKATMVDLAINDVPDEQILTTHAYASKATSLKFSPPGRFKRLITEITTLKTGLPPGIFVRYCENRPDVMKVAIIGPGGTPYENGIFEFDFFCDSSFPNKPPMVQFRGTGGGRISINPNLYADGKVCLSLLGTWAGEPWTRGESTLLQVVISLQAMIFCDEPWYNEPGREAAYHRGSGQDPAAAYNQTIREHTVRHAMLTWLDRPPQLWHAVVESHFKQNANNILKTVEEWAKKKVPNHLSHYDYVGFEMEDFMPPMGSRTSAVGKADLESMLPRLQIALQNHGATYVIQQTLQPTARQPSNVRVSMPQPTISYPMPPNPMLPLPLGPPPPYSVTQTKFPGLNLQNQGRGPGRALGSGGGQSSKSATNAAPSSHGGSIFSGSFDGYGRYETRSATRSRSGPAAQTGDASDPVGNAPPSPFPGDSRGRGGSAIKINRGGRGMLRGVGRDDPRGP